MTREEAIKNIKLFFTGINIALSNKTKEALDVLIPELRESEDERMRKAALEGIEYLERKLGWDFIGDTDILDVKEYLEKQKEQNPAELSEEDEKMLNDCIMALSNWRDAVANYGHEVAPCQRLIDWLKSLRPSWKPSKEQLEALGIAMDRNDSIGYNLRQLYEQLKKL